MSVFVKTVYLFKNKKIKRKNAVCYTFLLLFLGRYAALRVYNYFRRRMSSTR